MNKHLYIVVAMAALTACSSAKKSSSASNDLPALYLENIVADGNTTDWKNTTMYYNKSAQTAYAISNDKEALHVVLRFTDAAQQMKILRSGLEVYLDPAGRKSKAIAVKYPLPSAGAPEGRTRQEGERPNMQEMRDRMLADKKQIELTGFNTELNGISTLSHTVGVKAALKYEQNDLVYELTIPFDVLQTPLRADSPLAIGVTIKGMSMPGNGGGMQRGGGMGGGMGGPGGGGGMGRGQMPGGGQGQDMSKENSFWHRFTLGTR